MALQGARRQHATSVQPAWHSVCMMRRVSLHDAPKPLGVVLPPHALHRPTHPSLPTAAWSWLHGRGCISAWQAGAYELLYYRIDNRLR